MKRLRRSLRAFVVSLSPRSGDYNAVWAGKEQRCGAVRGVENPDLLGCSDSGPSKPAEMVLVLDIETDPLFPRYLKGGYGGG